MARKKVKLVYITNDSARRATFKKRKRGLLKKVSELSTLCGVSACAIVYGPYDRQPDVWPSPSEVHRVLMKFKSLPEMEQSKKMMNQELFLWQRIVKLREQLKKQQKENRYKEITHLMYQCLSGKSLHDVSTDVLSDLAWLIGEKGKDIQDRMDDLNKTATVTTTTTAIGGLLGHPVVQNTNTTTTTNNNNNNINSSTGININIGGDNHYYHHPQQQQEVVVAGMNIMNAGGGEQAAEEKLQVVDPMQATLENLQRQNWSFMDMNLNPTYHHDPMMGGYLGGGVLENDHLHQIQMQMQMLGMPSSYGGGIADNNMNININNAAAAAGWMANNPFFV